MHRTLESLLRQTVRPDHFVLWVAHEDLPSLPAKVTRLKIGGSPNIGSYKKLIPALRQFPGAFIATADDDLFYDPDWLRELTDEFDPARPSIMCHRAHRPMVMQDRAFAPYREWELDVRDEHARSACIDIIPTGCGAVLYHPGSLHPAMLDEALLRKFCPTAGDFWFYWMGRRAGPTYRKIGGPFRYLDWPGSQSCTLHSGNLKGAYDAQLAALVEHFGMLCDPQRGELEEVRPSA